MASNGNTETPKERLSRWFGNHRWQPKSPITFRYNCVGWAVGEPLKWWQPSKAGIPRYWPKNVPTDDSANTLALALGTEGFEVCSDGTFEPGWDKIAIFERHGEWTHACRILGEYWWSKLGEFEDVIHDKAGAEEIYGNVAIYMKRPRRWPDAT